MQSEPKLWTHKIQVGPNGEQFYSWVYDESGEMVGTFKIHHAVEVIKAMNSSPISADAVVEAIITRFEDLVLSSSHSEFRGLSDHAAFEAGQDNASAQFIAAIRALKGTFPAAPEAKSGSDEAEITTLRKELAEARAALEPFADVADFMDSETEGFSMDDELWLGIRNDEFPPCHIKSFALQLFYTARDAFRPHSKAKGEKK